jgi:NCS1 family nucleobase:cation symporter-1
MAVFTSVITAILVLDYFVIRKGAWKVNDLYHGGPQYIYWYWHGINLRACGVYLVTVIPSMRKSKFRTPGIMTHTN